LKIGGINLGDDLSQHLSSGTIQRGVKKTENWDLHLREPKKFKLIQVYGNKKINQKYKKVSFLFLKTQEKLIIHSIDYHKKNYSKMSFCKRDLDKLSNNLSKKFPDAVKEGPDSGKISRNRGDYYRYVFFDKNNNELSIQCSDWSKEIERKWGPEKTLNFDVNTLEARKWLENTK